MLIHGKKWWWEYFKREYFSLFSHIKGSILASHGSSEFEIKLDDAIKAKQVFVAVEAEGIPVCVGNVDKVGAILKDSNTFIVYADIKSNTAMVYWLVEYSMDEDNIDNI
jgi:hypothetical protein